MSACDGALRANRAPAVSGATGSAAKRNISEAHHWLQVPPSRFGCAAA
jgi:hypothetical protein